MGDTEGRGFFRLVESVVFWRTELIVEAAKFGTRGSLFCSLHHDVADGLKSFLERRADLGQPICNGQTDGAQLVSDGEADAGHGIGYGLGERRFSRLVIHFLSSFTYCC